MIDMNKEAVLAYLGKRKGLLTSKAYEAMGSKDPEFALRWFCMAEAIQFVRDAIAGDQHLKEATDE